MEKRTRYGAYGIIIYDGRLLLTEKKGGPYQGLWCLPGGGIEFGEAPEWTLKREIQEETAFTAEGLELTTILTNFAEYFCDGEHFQFHHVGIVYTVKSISPLSNCLPEEKMKWYSLSTTIPEGLSPLAKQAWSIIPKHIEKFV